MLSLIPPAGARTAFASRRSATMVENLRLYGSGTSAIAAVLRSLSASSAQERNEVIVPAYGCPALIAAILHAELVPVLADVSPASPFVSEREWARRSTDRTLAFLPVNFLGLCPKCPPDREAVAVIYDCCQGWPPGARCPDWALATVLSFGRGKPISLGSGGGVLLGAEMIDLPSGNEARRRNLFPVWAALYNRALHPRIYWWLDKVPFLGLGKTEYRPLREISEMSVPLAEHLPANIEAYVKTDGWTVSRVRSTIGTGELGFFRFLPAMQSAREDTRLLRLPILAEAPGARDAAVAALRRRGYGATALYREPLWKIRGLEFLEKYEGDCPNAMHFAGRLLTLPVHGRVSNGHLRDMAECLSKL